MAAHRAAAAAAPPLLLLAVIACAALRGVHAKENGGIVAGFPHPFGSAAPPAQTSTAAGDAFAEPLPPHKPPKSAEAVHQPVPQPKGLGVQTESIGGVDYVLFDATAKSGHASSLISQLQALRAVSISLAGDHHVSFRLPLGAVPQLHSLHALRFATRSESAFMAGSVESQGDVAMRTKALRDIFPNITGKGVKVGVMSDSYNSLRGAADDVASGDLPAGVVVLKDIAGGTDEGRAMMQLVHDVAPGSPLYFYTAFNGLADFANGIKALAHAGCKVIIDDVVNFGEPFFEDGIVAQAVDQVKAGGSAYFSSAQNQARQAWETVSWKENAGGYYLFAPGFNLQEFAVAPRTKATIVLQWDQPFGNCASDLDLLFYTYDSSSGTYKYYGGDAANNIGGDPLAIFRLDNSNSDYTGYAYLAIQRASGPAPGRVKYVYFGSYGPTEYLTNSPESFGHAQARGCFSVAAAPYDQTPIYGVSPAVVEDFSSLGGTPILFDPPGTRLAKPVIRLKPDATAPDGADTTFFGDDSDYDGLPNFFGTSAAAPHAGALAALLRQAKPSLTPDQLYNIMRLTADDMDNPYTSGFDYGFDFSTGYGFVNALEAYIALNCRTSCGTSTVTWPFTVDPGCGPANFLLTCNAGVLSYTTPSGTYAVAPPLRTDYLLLPSAATQQLTAYSCPTSSSKGFSTVGTPFNISASNVVMGYGTSVKASFTSYRANNSQIRAASCTTSSTNVPSYCNGTRCCSMTLGQVASRVTFSTSGNCGGVDILWPAAVTTTPVTPANAKVNYFLRLDFTSPSRPKLTQGCAASTWSASPYTCRWPYNLKRTTRLRDAFASTATGKAIVDSRYPSSTTLQQALTSTGTSAYAKLGIQAVAALLNAYQIYYPWYVSQVQSQFLSALGTNGNPTALITTFTRINNNKWCPITTC